MTARGELDRRRELTREEKKYIYKKVREREDAIYIG